MNATPQPHPGPEQHAPEARTASAARAKGTCAVPRQAHSEPEAEQLHGYTTDLLEHPAPGTVAQAATVENLLRCWTRENDLPAPEHGTLRIPLTTTGTALLVPVHYWSATGWHRFGPPAVENGPPDAAPTDAVTLAALLAREAAHRPTPAGPRATGRPGDPPDDPGTTTPPGRTTPEPDARPTATAFQSDGGELVARVADSVRRTAEFVADRREDRTTPGDLFLTAEQALLLGHPLHPTPKSREGLSGTDGRLYSPELRGSFRAHWLAVHHTAFSQDSAWTEGGRVVPADQLTSRLAGPGLPLPDGFAALPVHPWQTRDLALRPGAADLLDAGLLRPLGPHGRPWHPTSSVRTLYRSGAPAMLKLSLGLRITNSRRENLRKELHRGVEVHRLLRTGLTEQWRAAHPGFDIVRDPAWLAVDTPDGAPLTGLDVMIRHNPFRPADDVSCVAGLVSPLPCAPHREDEGHVPMHSRLAEIITRLAGRTGRPRGAVATEWFLRYLEQVVRPVLWLDSEAGIALEAHQQNTLLLLDPDGWPAGGRYRDNQGFYYRESRRAELERRLPGIGEHSDSFVSDHITDERFAYYLGINQVFGLIGAFGSQQLANEELLLAAFRGFLTAAAAGPRRLRTPLPALLLESPVLRCKANLLTRLHDLDELAGPVDTQSVYVTLTNPLHP